MKKKLEAELISIAHRILKLKNRAELDQLQQETLKLYEKISVLRFVEDNFSDVKPTIGHASAEEALEEIYGLEEPVHVHANEVEAKEATAKAAKAEGTSEKGEEEPVAEKKQEGKNDEVKEEPQVKSEEAQTEEAEKEVVKEEVPEAEENEVAKTEEPETAAPAKEEVKQEEPEKEEKPEEIKEEEPAVKVEVEKPAEELKAMEEAAAAVFEKEDQSTIEEEEKAADAEIVTIEPDPETKVEDTGLGFDFAFERPAAPEEPVKQKEITFEDYKDYKEPEFIKKSDVDAPEKPESKTEEAKPEEPKEPVIRDWRDWEPSKSGDDKAEEKIEEVKAAPKAEEKTEAKRDEPKPEAPKEEPKQESTVKGNIATREGFERARSLNDSLGKSISLGLNDRIAFEKHLFSGSADDLNRVLSQLNTINTFDEARDFINDLVKPDYNDWKGKEEYEERFMQLVEKKFS